MLCISSDSTAAGPDKPNGRYWPRSVLLVPVPCPCWPSDHIP